MDGGQDAAQETLRRLKKSGEGAVELEDRKRRHVTTNKAIRAEKDILSDTEAALIAATQAIEQHEEEFRMTSHGN